MKYIKIIFLILFFSILLTGCGPLISHLTFIEELALEGEIAVAESIANIGFTEGEVTENSENVVMIATDFTNYESEYNVYSSSLHYDCLNENEKLIYHALEYAMENSYSSVMVERNMVKDIKDLEKVLNYLSLDSPLLEQNLFYELGTVTTYHDIELDSIFPHKAKLDGYYITVKNFEKQWWDKKLEAIEEAKKRVAALPADLTKTEKAEQLFIQLCSGTEYVLSKRLNDTQVMPNLYDALISGKTQCDGFSNALSLLYNMAGITCSEKIYHATEEELGHTWNFFEIDGKWYNADATNPSLIPTDRTYMHAGMNFGFSDILQSKKHVFSANYPEGTEQLFMPVDGHFSSIEDEAFVDTAYDAYYAHQGQWTLILLDTYNEEAVDKQLKQLATKMRQTIYYLTFDCMDNRTALLIYEEGLINYIAPEE